VGIIAQNASDDLMPLLVIVALVIVALLVVAGLTWLMWRIACIPGNIARERRHLDAEAIRLCGILGALLFWPAWLIALVWAYTHRPSTDAPRRIHYSKPPMPGVLRINMEDRSETDDGPVEIPELGGTFEIWGVDRATGMDTRLSIAADSEANAKVKAELKGVVVTKVERRAIEDNGHRD
jgi:hypothetical protein